MAHLTRSWRPPGHAGSAPGRNVGQAERYASAAAGAALAVLAARRHARDSWLLGAVSAVLWYRATTGHCPAYAAAGVSTAGSDTKRALSGPRGVNVEAGVTVDRPAAELYRFWRRFENLPLVMHHLLAVEQIDPRRSRWRARAPMGATVEWEADVINEVPDKVIAWRSVEGSTVATAGSVNFDEQPGGRSTAVTVKLQYEPPAGKLGAWTAWLFGEEPSVQIREDLRRFKEEMEK